MRIISTTAVLKALVIVAVFFAANARANAPVFRVGGDGMIQPFKLKGTPLADFVRAYMSVAGVSLLMPSGMDLELKSSVTLFEPKPISRDALTELFHETLNDAGFSVVDAPGKAGWLIERSRDARDAGLPVYDMADVPATHRLITAVQTLEHVDSESMARVMRSFMPANSRIIPATTSKLLITDTGNNIRKIQRILEFLDIPLLAARPTAPVYSYGKCPGEEHRIEKVVIENLELPESGSGGAVSSQLGKRPSPTLNKVGGAR